MLPSSKEIFEEPPASANTAPQGEQEFYLKVVIYGRSQAHTQGEALDKFLASHVIEDPAWHTDDPFSWCESTISVEPMF